jgi:aspartyl protease family protein
MSFAVIGMFSILELDDGTGGSDGMAATTVMRGDSGESREMTIRGGRGGHFLVKADVNRVRIRFLIDTGATMVALSADDARRLKLNTNRLKYTERYQTANGIVRGAPVKLRQIRIGGLVVKNVRATVMSGNIGVSLLGNSFLRKLRGYEVRGDVLVLRW